MDRWNYAIAAFAFMICVALFASDGWGSALVAALAALYVMGVRASRLEKQQSRQDARRQAHEKAMGDIAEFDARKEEFRRDPEQCRAVLMEAGSAHWWLLNNAIEVACEHATKDPSGWIEDIVRAVCCFNGQELTDSICELAAKERDAVDAAFNRLIAEPITKLNRELEATHSDNPRLSAKELESLEFESHKESRRLMKLKTSIVDGDSTGRPLAL